MVVILKNQVDPKKVENLTNWLHEQKLVINEVVGEYQTILGLIGVLACMAHRSFEDDHGFYFEVEEIEEIEREKRGAIK